MTTGLIIVICVSVILLTRYFEVRRFLSTVSKVCNNYDWKYINKHPMCLIEKMKNEDGYFLTSEWSAYNFLYLKGPSPKEMFMSFKRLSLETVYDKEKLNRLKEYEVI